LYTYRGIIIQLFWRLGWDPAGGRGGIRGATELNSQIGAAENFSDEEMCWWGPTEKM